MIRTVYHTQLFCNLMYTRILRASKIMLSLMLSFAGRLRLRPCNHTAERVPDNILKDEYVAVVLDIRLDYTTVCC